MLPPVQLASLAVFASYFLAIIFLFGLIVTRSIPRPLTTDTERRPARFLFAALAGASFVHTWYYMIKFLQWSYNSWMYTNPHPNRIFKLSHTHRIALWLSETELFEQAWYSVSEHPRNWWWSEQVCLFAAGAWAVFLYVEGKRFRIPHLWAYMALAQLLALSTCVSLFFLALLSSPTPASPRPRSPATLYLPVLMSLATIAYSPHLLRSAFLWNLLAMHGSLIVPLVDWSAFIPASSAPSATPSTTSTMSTSTLLLITEAVAFTLRLLTTARLPSHSPRAILLTLYSHPAQSSIGFDVIYTSLAVAAWSLVRRGGQFTVKGAWEAARVMGLEMLAGPGVVGPWVARWPVRISESQAEVVAIEKSASDTLNDKAKELTAS